jgi:hypothetical protein
MEASPLTESVNHLHAWLALDDAEPALPESKRELRSRRRDWLKDILPDESAGTHYQVSIRPDRESRRPIRPVFVFGTGA